MSQQVTPQGQYTGLFVNPAAGRRAEFEAACSAQFAQLTLADSADAALAEPALATADLLVIDLERFDPELDHAGLSRLVTARADDAVVTSTLRGLYIQCLLLGRQPLGPKERSWAAETLGSLLDSALPDSI